MRFFGSLTTNSPLDDDIAKILPFTFSAPDPKPLLSPIVTPRSRRKASTTWVNLRSALLEPHPKRLPTLFSVVS
jgi:hypothetical protein